MGASNYFRTKDNVEVCRVLEDLGINVSEKGDSIVIIDNGELLNNDLLTVAYRNGKCLGGVDLLNQYSSIAEWLIETDNINMEYPVNTVSVDKYIQSMLIEDSYFKYKGTDGCSMYITSNTIKVSQNTCIQF